MDSPRQIKRRQGLSSGQCLRGSIQPVRPHQGPGGEKLAKGLIRAGQAGQGRMQRRQYGRKMTGIEQDVHGRSQGVVFMKAIAMLVVVVGNTFKVKPFMLLLRLRRHQRAKACKGERLPAHAKQKNQGDTTSKHPQILTQRENFLCLMGRVHGRRRSLRTATRSPIVKRSTR